MKIILLDSNILISFYTARYEDQYKKSTELLTSGQNFFIQDTVIAETEYILRRVYNISKLDIYEFFNGLLLQSNFKCNGYIYNALILYLQKNIDFTDSILLSISTLEAKTATFDKKLKKLLSSRSYL